MHYGSLTVYYWNKISQYLSRGANVICSILHVGHFQIEYGGQAVHFHALFTECAIFSPICSTEYKLFPNNIHLEIALVFPLMMLSSRVRIAATVLLLRSSDARCSKNAGAAFFCRMWLRNKLSNTCFSSSLHFRFTPRLVIPVGWPTIKH